MARKSAVAIAAAILAAFAVGLLLGRYVIPGGSDFGARQTIAQGAGIDTPSGPRRDFQRSRGENARRPGPAVVEGFQFLRLDMDTSGDSPKACFQFSARLDESGKTNYGDYVRLSPSVRPAVEVAGQTLCISGLAFDKDYRATLRAGLPSASGDKLERPQEVAIAFGDKPAYVGFAGDGVVLPRLEADGLGVETVNVEKIEITVRRVSDRSLARKEIVKGDSVPENDYYYVYDSEDGEDVGALVYKGELNVKGDRNQTKSTVFPLGAALKDLKAGAYFVRIRDVSPGADEYRTAQAWRWVMFTDIALTTYSSGEGIDVIARSLSTARPLSGVNLTLIATNNDQLATAVTDGDGRARFDGPAVHGDYPLTPRMIMAYGAQDDFAVIDLQRAPLDLSDRNVSGRAAPSKLDAYVYLDRGIYRPGETAHITGLLRDDAGLAVADRPLTLIVRRPNYTEAEKIRIEKSEIGGFARDFAVPSSAPRGVWTLEVAADGVGNVGSASFSVEDFVPQRLEVTLDMDEKTPIRPGDTRAVNVKSRFLYGAPASGLAVEAEARLRLDPNPFPDFSAYRFGPVDGRFDERFLKLPNATLDGAGNASLELAVDDAPKGVGAPLRADLVVGVVEPGGRVVRESARIPVRPDERYVGLRLAGDGGGVGQGEPVEIDAVVLGWNGETLSSGLEWRLVEEDYWFDWYREDGEWRWRRSYKDVLVGEGRAQVAADEPVKITQSLDPGSYRMMVTDPESGAKSDIRFYVGWRSYAAGADTPDQAALSTPTEPITPGARARFFLNPPYAGEAIVTVATDKVQLVQRLNVGKNGREIIIDTDPSWGAGFYVLATVVTPRDVVDRPVPRRAMAVAYAPFDMSARKLAVSVDAPELLRPRQKVDMPVTIAGAQRGEKVMLTLSAVDEGILRLTKFSSPDPVGYYYGKKRLGVEVRDDYGRILHANLGAPARFGGDQLGGEGLTVVPTKSVALYSGMVTVGADGKARVPVEIPDFNGELRLMAVAWSADKLGSASRPLTVRDPVPAEVSLSRFLAPGDKADATLLIDNVDGAAGDYRVTLAGDGPISLSSSQTFSLAKGEKKQQRFTLSAGETGIGAVTLNVQGPDGFAVERSYPIQVRTPYFPVTETSTMSLAPGETFTATPALLASFVPGSGEATVSFSRLRGLEPGPLLDSLYRYPYGCSEQLTSSAMPLLFVDVLGGEAGRGPERAVRPRVQKAVNTLLERQSSDGAFGLWAEGDGWASPWLGAYVADFLYRASQQGYGVPEESMNRAYDALAQIARVDRWMSVRYQVTANTGTGSNDTNDYLRRRSAAYAFYVLARAGRADLSDLRYFHDALLDKTPSPLAKAHIAAALALMGDRARSTSAFKKAVDAIGFKNTGDYYQTPLRDAAGVLALAAEAGRADLVDSLAGRFADLMRAPEELHTQEKAFVLLASQALLKNAGPLALSSGGKRLENLKPAPSFTLDSEALKDGVSYRNDGDGPVFRTVTVSGAPSSAPPATAQGFALEKRVATRDGRPADLGAVKQNDRLVVVLTGQATADRLHPAIIADLLPAGFEIEAVLKPEDGAGYNDSGPYKWVGEISYTKVAEARDDRFVAAIDIRRDRFTLAYIVRAVTPGTFVMPGAVIEDMYRPGVVGRTAAQSLNIAAAQ
ncbi:MAG: alpha-2-macroglobulin [Pseudomonadota bacterium]|nr:alpha-2-macroglobulin [Pseudomonadota bacterium]